MEIERKFTLKSLPDNLDSYPSLHIEQAYLSTNPVVRVRKENDEYYIAIVCYPCNSIYCQQC